MIVRAISFGYTQFEALSCEDDEGDHDSDGDDGDDDDDEGGDGDYG